MVREYAEEQRYTFLGGTAVDPRARRRARDRPVPGAQRGQGRGRHRAAGRCAAPPRRPPAAGQPRLLVDGTRAPAHPRRDPARPRHRRRHPHRRPGRLAPPRRDPARREVVLRDLGSTNGTYVDGVQVGEIVLHDGAVDPARRHTADVPGGVTARVRARPDAAPPRASCVLLWALVAHDRGRAAPRPARPARRPPARRRARARGRAKPAKAPKRQAEKAAKASRSGTRSLVVIEGALAGTVIPLGTADVTIGRAPDSTLVLDDDYASNAPRAHHAWSTAPGSSRTSARPTAPGSTARASPARPPSPSAHQLKVGRTVLELRK